MTIDIKKDDLPATVTPRDLGIYGANTGPEPEFTDARTGVTYSIDREATQSRVMVTLPPKTGIVCDRDFTRKGGRDVGIESGMFEWDNLSARNWVGSYMSGEPLFMQRFFNATDTPKTLTLEANKAIMAIDLDKAGGEYVTRKGAFAGAAFSRDGSAAGRIERAQPDFTFSLNPLFKLLSGDTLIKQSIETSPGRAAIALVTAKGSVGVREIEPDGHYDLSTKPESYHGFSSDFSRSWGVRWGELFGAWWHGDSLCKLKLKHTFDQNAAHTKNYIVIDAGPDQRAEPVPA